MKCPLCSGKLKQQEIQMNVVGQIGDKLKIATNYNTEASFEFENKMNKLLN
jgi:cell surface protein SprA